MSKTQRQPDAVIYNRLKEHFVPILYDYLLTGEDGKTQLIEYATKMGDGFARYVTPLDDAAVGEMFTKRMGALLGVNTDDSPKLVTGPIVARIRRFGAGPGRPPFGELRRYNQTQSAAAALAEPKKGVTPPHVVMLQNLTKDVAALEQLVFVRMNRLDQQLAIQNVSDSVKKLRDTVASIGGDVAIIMSLMMAAPNQEQSHEDIKPPMIKSFAELGKALSNGGAG